MAYVECNFKSRMLKQDVAVNIIMPYYPDEAPKSPPAVLYLLHGLSDDHTAWQRKTSIERYMVGMNLAVVMPAVHRSFYTNTKTGIKYFDFVSKELPYLLDQMFKVSGKKDDTFVAGLSMGGYGAFKLALTYPENYFAAASLSGALDLTNPTRYQAEFLADKERLDEMKFLFGENGVVRGDQNDLFGLIDRVCLSGADKPKLMQICGTEDFLYEENQNFKNYIETKGFDYSYFEGPGTHSWGFWDNEIQNVLKWIKQINKTV